MVRMKKRIFSIVRTRFSVKSGKWGNYVPDEKWLNFRMDMLEKCGLNAMRMQTCKDFIWFIEASPETYEFVKEHVCSWNMPSAFAIRSKGDKNEGFAKISQEYFKLIPESQMYVNIRVDSDDVLHPDTVYKFSKYISNEFPIVGVEKGFKLDWFGGKICKHNFIHSAILGQLSTNKDGVFGPGGHKTIRTHFNHISFIDIPFIQIVHGTNVRAKISEKSEVLSKKDFGNIISAYNITWEPTNYAPDGRSQAEISLNVSKSVYLKKQIKMAFTRFRKLVKGN
ncbi:MAG: hypothetical protein GF398_21100 [Chitinivibrionales bacterium]|nr:hypothetical protein [Chitinivibrionales bacterium]